MRVPPLHFLFLVVAIASGSAACSVSDEAADGGSDAAGGQGGGMGGTGGAGGAGGGTGGTGGSGGTGGTGGSGGTGGMSGPCMPEGGAMHESLGADHVGSSAGVKYNSNPPSSGPHCGVWGTYGVFKAKPLPRCNYVHNLEHGAVVLAYKCADGCPDVVAKLEEIRTNATDPDCTNLKRIIVTPDADLDVMVGAAAWQHTWRSGCFDADAAKALATWVDEHIGTKGIAPEADVCADGYIDP